MECLIIMWLWDWVGKSSLLGLTRTEGVTKQPVPTGHCGVTPRSCGGAPVPEGVVLRSGKTGVLKSRQGSQPCCDQHRQNDGRAVSAPLLVLLGFNTFSNLLFLSKASVLTHGKTSHSCCWQVLAALSWHCHECGICPNLKCISSLNSDFGACEDVAKPKPQR